MKSVLMTRSGQFSRRFSGMTRHGAINAHGQCIAFGVIGLIRCVACAASASRSDVLKGRVST